MGQEMSFGIPLELMKAYLKDHPSGGQLVFETRHADIVEMLLNDGHVFNPAFMYNCAITPSQSADHSVSDDLREDFSLVEELMSLL